MNTHAGIVNRLLWMQEAYGLNSSDCVLQKTPYSFDVSVWEFFWPLITGARLVLAQPEGHKDSAYLSRLINEQEVTTVHFVPSMLQVFVESGELEKCRPLRRVICSGEALPFELQERFMRASTAELHNLYGPTEAAVDVTFWECERGDKRGIVPIGRPIANTEIYLLDERRQVVPVGVRGELYIGGAGLARGYYESAGMTAERFVPHPFSRRGGERLYRTGDVARYLEGGEIEYLGRLDHQVKMRGFRIELGEIEAAVCALPGVREAVLEVRAGAETEKRLVAYVVCEEGMEVSLSQLRNQLKERLPDYMVPAAFVSLPRMPLTRNGKVDRRALPEPEALKGSGGREGHAEPRTPVEELLCGIWAEVLGVKDVGIHDNFFELGGHSLLATRVVSRVKERFGIEFELRNLFVSPTVATLAALVEKSLIGQAATDEVAAALEQMDQLSDEDIKALLLSEGQLTADPDASQRGPPAGIPDNFASHEREAPQSLRQREKAD